MYGAVLHRQRVLIAAVLYAGYIRRQAYILYPVQQRRVFLITFWAQVSVGKKALGTGKGRTKKAAEQAAAYDAILARKKA